MQLAKMQDVLMDNFPVNNNDGSGLVAARLLRAESALRGLPRAAGPAGLVLEARRRARTARDVVAVPAAGIVVVLVALGLMVVLV